MVILSINIVCAIITVSLNLPLLENVLHEKWICSQPLLVLCIYLFFIVNNTAHDKKGHFDYMRQKCLGEDVLSKLGVYWQLLLQISYMWWKPAESRVSVLQFLKVPPVMQYSLKKKSLYCGTFQWYSASAELIISNILCWYCVLSASSPTLSPWMTMWRSPSSAVQKVNILQRDVSSYWTVVFGPQCSNPSFTSVCRSLRIYNWWLLSGHRAHKHTDQQVLL